MGLFDELITMVREAIDEVNQRDQPPSRGTSPVRPPAPTSLEEIKERIRQAQAQPQYQPQAAQQPQVRRPAAQPRPSAPAAAPGRATEARPEPPAPRTSDQPARPTAMPANERFARLLRPPQTMRELFVLKELLDRPLALRRRRH